MKYRNGKPVPVLVPVTIEKGVPIPPPGDRNSALMASARLMDIGDSVVIPYDRKPNAGNMARASGFKFTQQVEWTNDMEKLLRIWRIK